MNNTSLNRSLILSTERIGNSLRGGLPVWMTVCLILACTSPALAQVALVFQQGVGGYAGTHDTTLQSGDVGNVLGTAGEWEWDGEDAGGINIGLLRFDDIVGANPGQVPPGSTVLNAVITLLVTNEGGAGEIATMHELLIPFDDAVGYSGFGDGGGPQPGVNHEAAVTASIDGPPAGAVVRITVTESVRKIVAGETFHGWIVIPDPAGTNGVGVASSESGGNGPILTVTIEGASPPDVRRTLSRQLYDASGSINVSLEVSLVGGINDATIVETIPSGWTASGISDGGTFANGAITWNLPGFTGTSTLTYVVQAPASPADQVSFDGVVNDTLVVLGDSTAELRQGVGIFEHHTDIGAPGAEGSATFDAGTSEYEVVGSGHDIWDAADDFHFALNEITGAFSIRAEVFADVRDGDATWTKAGLMVRDNLSAGSANGFGLVRSDQQFRPQWRGTQGSSSEAGALVSDYTGEIEIERIGTTVNFYYFQDDVRVFHSSMEVPGLQDPVYVGLAVTSHNTGSLSAGFFTNMAIAEYPATVGRRLPATSGPVGRPLQGVSLTADVREGQSANLTITETAPAGWTVSNLNPSAGSASLDADGNIVWTISGATGSPTLTYDATPPEGALGGQWSGTASAGSLTFPISGTANWNAFPTLYRTGNVLAVGVWNESNGSSDLAATAELSDNNGVIYVQDSSAPGGWPQGTTFRWKTVLFDDGAGEEEPGWMLREFTGDTPENDWIEQTDIGFTIGHGGNDGENGETLLETFDETVYTRSIFDIADPDSIVEMTLKLEGDDAALAWLNGVYIGFAGAGNSDRGEVPPDFVYDTTTDPDSGGVSPNPSTYLQAEARIFTIQVKERTWTVDRSIPATHFIPGTPIGGITLTADLGSSPLDITVTETPPSGWGVSNLSPSSGSADVDAGGNIIWTLTGATGTQTLTFDVAPPSDATMSVDWSGSSTNGTVTLDTSGPTSLGISPPLYRTGNVLAIGVYNESNTSSDLAASADLSDNNGFIYVQDTGAPGGWPVTTTFRWKTVLFDDGTGAEEPGWQLRDFANDTAANGWTEQTGVGFTIGHGGNDGENGETLLTTADETVYTRSIFDAQAYESIMEMTLKLEGDDAALAWLNGVYIGFAGAGNSDRGEVPPDFVFDTTTDPDSGGVSANPATYTQSQARTWTFPLNLVDGPDVPVTDWPLY